MAKKSFNLSIFFGAYSLLIGAWYCYQNFLVLVNPNFHFSIYYLLKSLGAVIYLIAGVGILKNRKWGGYVITILMLYLVYAGIGGSIAFIHRLKLGYIFSTWYEIFVGIFLSLYFLLPLLAVWNFLLRKFRNS